MVEKFIFILIVLVDLKLNYDVVIIGLGGVGLIVVIQVYELGLNLVILEKMLKIGGNIIWVLFGMNVVEMNV